jgi:hypothetical protein
MAREIVVHFHPVYDGYSIWGLEDKGYCWIASDNFRAIMERSDKDYFWPYVFRVLNYDATKDRWLIGCEYADNLLHLG